jgi:hypothetical protein
VNQAQDDNVVLKPVQACEGIFVYPFSFEEFLKHKMLELMNNQYTLEDLHISRMWWQAWRWLVGALLFVDDVTRRLHPAEVHIEHPTS